MNWAAVGEGCPDRNWATAGGSTGSVRIGGSHDLRMRVQDVSTGVPPCQIRPVRSIVWLRSVGGELGSAFAAASTVMCPLVVIACA